MANEKSYYVEFDTTYSAEQAVKARVFTLVVDMSVKKSSVKQTSCLLLTLV